MSPSPIIVEFSEDLRSSIDGVMTETDYERVDQSRQDFLSRVACRVLLLPSGATFQSNLQSPPGAMVYGKLLYGGVTRYRILGNTANSKRPKRKAGERTVIAPPPKGDALQPTEAWVSRMNSSQIHMNAVIRLTPFHSSKHSYSMEDQRDHIRRLISVHVLSWRLPFYQKAFPFHSWDKL